jgi:ribosomal protein L37AE/L43A
MDTTPIPTAILHDISTAWAERFSTDTGLVHRRAPGSGDYCPNCRQGTLNYNGMLELECPHCGYTLSGGGGCT